MSVPTKQDRILRTGPVTAKLTDDVELIRDLAVVEDPTIISAILQNPNTPLDVLERFIYSPIYRHVLWATGHPSLTPDYLRNAFKLEDSALTHGIALNDNTPEDVLITIIQNSRICKRAFGAICWREDLTLRCFRAAYQNEDWEGDKEIFAVSQQGNPAWTEFQHRLRAEQLGMVYEDYPDHFWEEI